MYYGILVNHKKNEILPIATKLMQLKTIILSEISKSQKDEYNAFFDLCSVIVCKYKKHIVTYMSTIDILRFELLFKAFANILEEQCFFF